MPLLNGTRLGPYEIQHLLGAGGMGEVYHARDSNLKRDVAINKPNADPAGFNRRSAATPVEFTGFGGTANIRMFPFRSLRADLSRNVQSGSFLDLSGVLAGSIAEFVPDWDRNVRQRPNVLIFKCSEYPLTPTERDCPMAKGADQVWVVTHAEAPNGGGAMHRITRFVIGKGSYAALAEVVDSSAENKRAQMQTQVAGGAGRRSSLRGELQELLSNRRRVPRGRLELEVALVAAPGLGPAAYR